MPSSPFETEKTILKLPRTGLLAHLGMAALSSPTPDAPPPADSAQETLTFKIRYASNSQRRQSAKFLVDKLYSHRGLGTNGATGPAAEKYLERVCLLIYGANECPVGTITVGADGPRGLYADELYGPEVMALRQQGLRLAEITKLAVDRHGGNSKRVLASLINVAYVHTRLMGCSHAVIEVNPRHMAFYLNSFGCKQIGPERLCTRVNAPAVLLLVDLNHMADQIRLYGGTDATIYDSDDKNFYRYFLSPQDQDALFRQLRQGPP